VHADLVDYGRDIGRSRPWAMNLHAPGFAPSLVKGRIGPGGAARRAVAHEQGPRVVARRWTWPSFFWTLDPRLPQIAAPNAARRIDLLRGHFSRVAFPEMSLSGSDHQQRMEPVRPAVNPAPADVMRRNQRISMSPTFEKLTPAPCPDAPAAQETHVLREAVSLAGHPIRLTLDRGTHQGARPYYAVARLQSDGRVGRVVRYTPFLERAEFLFEQFRQEITDPAGLAMPEPVARKTSTFKLANARRGLALADEALRQRRARRCSRTRRLAPPPSGPRHQPRTRPRRADREQ
jgi:hypothetical protein